MPALDRYHQQVRNALEKDGWTITHDPLRLQIGEDMLYVDLGAEQVLAAEKGVERIAVEIKSFTAASEVSALQDAIGQYLMVLDIVAEEVKLWTHRPNEE